MFTLTNQSIMKYKVTWTVVDDLGEHELSDSQFNELLKAESLGARFVVIGDHMFNPAFVKGAFRKRIESNQPIIFDEVTRKAYRVD